MHYYLKPIILVSSVSEISGLKFETITKEIGKREKRKKYTEEEIIKKFGENALEDMKNFKHPKYVVEAEDLVLENLIHKIRTIPKSQMTFEGKNNINYKNFIITSYRDRKNGDYTIEVYEKKNEFVNELICDGRWERDDKAIPYHCKEIAIEKLKRFYDYNDPFKTPDDKWFKVKVVHY